MSPNPFHSSSVCQIKGVKSIVGTTLAASHSGTSEPWTRLESRVSLSRRRRLGGVAWHERRSRSGSPKCSNNLPLVQTLSMKVLTPAKDSPMMLRVDVEILHQVWLPCKGNQKQIANLHLFSNFLLWTQSTSHHWVGDLFQY